MENKNNFWKGALIGALAMFFVGAIVVTGADFIKGKATEDKIKQSPVVSKEQVEKLEVINALIDEKYLNKVDRKKLEDGLYAGYLSGLEDTYAAYYNKEDGKNLLETTEGKYVGVGALLSQSKETSIITVTEVFEEGPGKEAGLKNLDMIMKVDGIDIAGEDLTDVVSKIKGEAGTEVNLTVFREQLGEELELKITRRKVESPTVVHEMKDGQIGYIRIKEFDTVTFDQFSEALTDLQNQGMEGLVVDLRSNPGGNLSTVCDMLNLMLPEGLIVYTEDKEGNREEIKSEGKTPFDKPLTILVNEFSASAAEIFAGAIQDYQLGDIVGTTTYGKGVVQQLFDLKDGTYLKFTTSEYFTPKGRNIDGKGIEPDVSIKYEVNPNDENADNQLDKAIEIVQSKITQP